MDAIGGHRLCWRIALGTLPRCGWVGLGCLALGLYLPGMGTRGAFYLCAVLLTRDRLRQEQEQQCAEQAALLLGGMTEEQLRHAALARQLLAAGCCLVTATAAALLSRVWTPAAGALSLLQAAAYIPLTLLRRR